MTRSAYSNFFKLRCPPGVTWPARPIPEVSTLWAALLELQRTQWLSPAEIEQGQLRQFRLLLGHCLVNVPYYRDQFTQAGIVPQHIQSLDDFRRIPILERLAYRQETARLRALSLPPGTVQTGKGGTSGTSGMPIEVLQTNVVNFWWLAFMLRDLEWCGLDPRGTLAAVRTTGKTGKELARLREGVSLPNWGSYLDPLIETGRSYGMDVSQDPRLQLQWLRRVAPDYLLSYPSNLEFLAGLVGDEGQAIPTLRRIQAIGETLTDDVRARIESGFGVPVKNVYTCVEAGYVASPCPDGHGMHVHAENVILEVLDEQGQPCPPGESGRVVLTTLHNFLAPFIRYEILDEAEKGPDCCPCGRGLPLLNRVQGKRRIMFRLPNGNIKRSSPLAFAIRRVGGFHQFQVVQQTLEDVLIRIVPDRTWTAEHPARLTEAIVDFFESPVRVQVQTRDRIELTRGGKMWDFVSELEPVRP